MIRKFYIDYSFLRYFPASISQGIVSFKKIVWYSSLYLDTNRELEFLESSDWFSLRIDLSFSSRLTLKSPRNET